MRGWTGPGVLDVGLIDGVDVVFYGVCNMDRSVAFYEGVLGLELSQRAGNDWVQFSVGGVEIGLFGELATAPHQGGAVVTFRVGDIKAVEAALEAAGVKKDPVEDMGGALSMEFTDPDGNRLIAVEIQG
jgi:catechol 2,3-dioxygenase-like lactoylglutathione lyase family enzyme